MEALGKQAETVADTWKGSLSTHTKQKYIECLAKDVCNTRYTAAYSESEECRLETLYELQNTESRS